MRRWTYNLTLILTAATLFVAQPLLSPAEAAGLQALCFRDLPTGYPAGGTLDVSLDLTVDADNPPTTLSVIEFLPQSLTVADPGTGDTSDPTKIVWTFAEGEAASQLLSYSLAVPAQHTGVITFYGSLTYPGEPSQDISGDTELAPDPPIPHDLQVAFTVDAHLSWLPTMQDGIAGFWVYRSDEGGAFFPVSELVTNNTFVDRYVETGTSYQYKAISQNTTGGWGDPADSPASEPAAPTMIRVQFEDYDYEGGNYPGGQGQNGYAAAYRSDLDDTDFFYQADSMTNSYRPDDDLDIPAINVLEYYVSGTTPSDWWRYTFDLELDDEGYAKIGAIRAASNGDAVLEFLWDERHAGWFSFNTGGLSNWQSLVVDTPAFFLSQGNHTLRVILAEGEADFDYLGVGFNEPEPEKITLFSDDFEDYNTAADLEAVWTIEGSGVGGGDGAWQLWSTTGDPLGYESPDLPGMTGTYVISDSEFAGPGLMDEKLISPEVDCTNYLGVTIEFGSNIQIYEPDVGIPGVPPQVYDVDVQTYDEGTQSWSDWINVFHHEGTDGDSFSPGFVDIHSVADGKKIKLRWRFWEADYVYWWAVDNVRVTAEEPPPAPPEVLSVGIEANAFSLTWEPFGTGNYRVQYTDDLTSGSWADVPGYSWPITDTQWIGDDVSAVPQRSYRVISE